MFRCLILAATLAIQGCATQSSHPRSAHSSLTVDEAREIAMSTAKSQGVDVARYAVTPVFEGGEWLVYFEHLDKDHIPRRLCYLATPAGGEFVPIH